MNQHNRVESAISDERLFREMEASAEEDLMTYDLTQTATDYNATNSALKLPNHYGMGTEQ